MKTFIVACVAAIIIAVIGGVVLNSVQEPVENLYHHGRAARGISFLRHSGTVN